MIDFKKTKKINHKSWVDNEWWLAKLANEWLEKKIKPMALFLLHNITINDACRLVVVVVVYNTYIYTSNWNSILEVICTSGNMSV